MDNLQPFGAEEGADDAAEDEAAIERPPHIGTDERRMHVRAYNHWASLLRNHAYPAIEDLNPDNLDDFGPNSVLLDFTSGVNNPVITWLGQALRAECDLDNAIQTVSEVPSGSLLSRLTDHYMQIIANQAPVGFEAEFVNHHGRNTLYRGILMPFSSDDDNIDFIYGVINWKEIVDPAIERELQAEVSRELAEPRAASAKRAVPVWADGPSGQKPKAPIDLGHDDEAETESKSESENETPAAMPEPESLADRLVIARASADEAKSSHERSRAALYEALGRAYDFALAAEDDAEAYHELLDDAGITRQHRAPMTPVAKLVFGAGYDKRRLTEFAAALAHGRRQHIGSGDFESWIGGHAGGLKAIVAAERAARRPASKAAPRGDARQSLRDAIIQGFVTLDTDTAQGDEFALLVARRMPDGRFGVIGAVPHDKSLTEAALRKLAGRR